MSDLWLIVSDLKTATLNLQVADFAPIFRWLIWLVLLLVTLKGVDYRDNITKWSYVAVLMAVGCLLLIAIPEGFSTNHLGPGSIFLAIILASVAHSLWFLKSSSASLGMGRVKENNGKTAK